ncbi:MAG: hypothetical protein PHW52_00445 [Candidatus Pacebacteria bacterium]|nr:hypothetical protein [Candidatus Paceibacterota bacterium]
MKKQIQKNISSRVGSIILFSLTIIVLIIYSYLSSKEDDSLYDMVRVNIPKISIVDKRVGADPLNAYYMIGSEVFKLENGKGVVLEEKKDVPINVSGNPIIADLDNKNVKDDAIMILSKVSDNDNKLYYVTASIKNFYGYKGLNAILLEGVSEVNSVNYENGFIKVNGVVDKKSVISYFGIKDNKLIKVN